jgi:hypothetical protein
VGIQSHYPLYGQDAGNHVQDIGVRGPYGRWLGVRDCTTWRNRVNDGDYDFLVIPTAQGDALQWSDTDPATKVLQDGALATVFEVTGDLDPQAC